MSDVSLYFNEEQVGIHTLQCYAVGPITVADNDTMIFMLQDTHLWQKHLLECLKHPIKRVSEDQWNDPNWLKSMRKKWLKSLNVKSYKQLLHRFQLIELRTVSDHEWAVIPTRRQGFTYWHEPSLRVPNESPAKLFTTIHQIMMEISQ